QVISQSLASAEDAFGSPQSLLNLRYAFEDAKDAGVTVLGSSGDSGTANVTKQALVGNGTGGPTGGLIPTPSVVWPASDPLVTGVGGTNLCSDPLNTSSRVLDAADPPTTCRGQGEIEIGWIGSGGGFSHVFGRPSFQDALPAGSTAIPADARGVPDVAYDASARTGVLVYVTLPPAGLGGLPCPGGPCSTGWYVVGGTSAGSPQWAGLIAIADQLNGGGLGWINPALYEIGADPARYAADFFDVTTGNNTQPGTGIPGYPATTGWDPVTGLGTPNAAVFLPDLVAAVNGHGRRASRGPLRRGGAAPAAPQARSAGARRRSVARPNGSPSSSGCTATCVAPASRCSCTRARIASSSPVATSASTSASEPPPSKSASPKPSQRRLSR